MYQSICKFKNLLYSLFNRSKNLRQKYPYITSLNQFIHRNTIENYNDSKSLDLGCGLNPRNPFRAASVVGIDKRRDLNSKIIEVDLFHQEIPFQDNSFDFCTAFDFIEHVPRVVFENKETRFPFIELMDQIYRVLKPGGIFLHLTPAYPSKEAFQDPTHVNLITEDTFPNYFCRPNRRVFVKERIETPEAANYGFKGDFTLIDQGWIKSAWVVGLMRAEK